MDAILRYRKLLYTAQNYICGQKLNEIQLKLVSHDVFFRELVLLNEEKIREIRYESIPQLILQVYIILDEVNRNKFKINITSKFSFNLNINN